MPEPLEDFLMSRPPTAERPLLGHTVLVVEDSRFACEAMRLLCLRSGARIRRADSLRSAHRHLRTYRPSVIVVDLGLPDGSGIDLIRDLAAAVPRIAVILATSGEDDAATAAMGAGADGFLPKPITSLAVFQEAVLSRIPVEGHPPGLRTVPQDDVAPDRIALRDDLAHIADVLDTADDDRTLDYIARFIAGVAKSAADRPLQTAAQELATDHASGRPTQAGLARVAGLVQDRLGRRSAV